MQTDGQNSHLPSYNETPECTILSIDFKCKDPSWFMSFFILDNLQRRDQSLHENCEEQFE